MPKNERYDIVIVGDGPNGMGTAAYLAKSGLRLCVLEERTECGGIHHLITFRSRTRYRLFPDEHIFTMNHTREWRH